MIDVKGRLERVYHTLVSFDDGHTVSLGLESLNVCLAEDAITKLNDVK
jgi:hypothetical protein